MPGGAETVRDLIAAGERSFSFEFFPPKDADGERQLWTALRELEPLQPTFVSVTYGAGGSTRDRTLAITERIAQDTSMTPLAHLTCVGHSRETLCSGRTPARASATCWHCAVTRPPDRARRGCRRRTG
jgi:methylenetetrahydrofolate reductase (NADPH)